MHNGVVNLGLKQMGQGSKQQEWITWKQWALSHEEWNGFWSEKKAYYLDHEKQRLEVLEEKEKEKKIAKEKSRKRGNKIALILLFWWVPLGVIGGVIGGIKGVVNYSRCGQFECPPSEPSNKNLP